MRAAASKKGYWFSPVGPPRGRALLPTIHSGPSRDFFQRSAQNFYLRSWTKPRLDSIHNFLVKSQFSDRSLSATVVSTVVPVSLDRFVSNGFIFFNSNIYNPF
jgi:hypothetical protein